MGSKVHRIGIFTAGVLLTTAAFGAASTPTNKSTPIIKITEIPPAGPGGELPIYTIAGTVENAPPGSVIIAWAHSAQAVYWVQPRGDFYRTPVGSSGQFSILTHPGMDYSIAVTRSTFSSPMVRKTLPNISDDVLAIATVSGKTTK